MLQLMICQNLIISLDGVPSDSENFDCEACICGKMMRAPFQRGHDVANKCLGHLHSNVCGLMEMMSLGKKQYLCILVDD